jgi:hypothetical protein
MLIACNKGMEGKLCPYMWVSTLDTRAVNCYTIGIYVYSSNKRFFKINRWIRRKINLIIGLKKLDES